MSNDKRVILGLCGIIALAVAACGDDDDESSGSAGKGGMAGSAAAGKGGSAGSSTAGRGGMSNTAGKGGATSTAGKAGSGGTAEPAGGSAGEPDAGGSTMAGDAAGGAAGAAGAGSIDGFTQAEWAQISQFGPLGAVPTDPTNQYADSAAAAAFGQRLFFEKGYAGKIVIGSDGSNGGLGAVDETGKVACASCHDPAHYYSDSRSNPNALSLGVKWTSRNAPPLVNVAFYTWMSWGGKEDSLWYQGANGSESPANFGGNRLQFVHLLYAKYKNNYNGIFPVPLDPALDPAAADHERFPPSGKPKAAAADADGPWELMAAADRDIVNRTLANAGKCIAAYERLLVSRNAPIDKYIAGDYGALSASAKQGLKLFIGKAGCVSCHSGPTLSDQSFHNIGVPQTGANVPATDNGRFDDLTKTLTNTFNGQGAYSDDPTAGAAKLNGLTPSDEMKGKFRTAALRQIDETGPYTHDGYLATLADVVHFYNLGGAETGFAGTKDPRITPLDLNADEEALLVEFLKSLTGEPPPPALGVDTAAP
jgi:cytochrome c peroxidase